MHISNAVPQDLVTIKSIYAAATLLQDVKGLVSWPVFSDELILENIADKMLWKMEINNSIACIWTTAFNDPLIWEDDQETAAVYLHRIAVHPDFRGRKLVERIARWTKVYAATHQKDYIRMDTVGNNTSLIHHYTSCGFDFLGFKKMKNTTGLPAHYHGATLSLFQLRVPV